MNIIRWTVLSACILSGFAVAGDGAGEWPERYNRLMNEYSWLSVSYANIAHDFRALLEPAGNLYQACISVPCFEQRREDHIKSVAAIDDLKKRLDQHTQEQTGRIDAIEPEIRRSAAELQMSKQAKVNNGDGKPSLSVGKQPKPDAGYKKRYILAGGVAGAACLALGMAVGYKIALRSSVPA